jgi:hypothetical protein
MIEIICPPSDIFDIVSREKEVVIIKKHDRWTEFFFDTKEDIDGFINELIKARDNTFGKKL